MTTPLLAEPLGGYLDGLVPERDPELQAMETYANDHKFPIIGPACGWLCYQLTRMLGARQIFELGSGYGYSTAWFTRAVLENGGGTVHHVVWDEELSNRARSHLGKLGFDGTVEYHVGEAVATLRDASGPFDLIFNDIDKQGYPAALPVIREKLRPGGLMIVDNLLWQGRIFDSDDHDATTEGVRELTRLVSRDNAWVSSIIPIRDGLLIAYKT